MRLKTAMFFTFLAESFRAELLKELPKDKYSGGGEKELAHRTKLC